MNDVSDHEATMRFLYVYVVRKNIYRGPDAIFFSVVNICIELSLYAVAVRFLDYRFFLL